MGLIFLLLMFIVPLVIALNGMFGSQFATVFWGRQDDRVRYSQAGDPAKPDSSGGSQGEQTEAKDASTGERTGGKSARSTSKKETADTQQHHSQGGQDAKDESKGESATSSS